MSSLPNPVTASEKVTVTVAVSPTVSALSLIEMVAVGAMSSTLPTLIVKAWLLCSPPLSVEVTVRPTLAPLS